MDTLDRFRKTAENITQRFEQLQRAVAAGDVAAEHCFRDLVGRLNDALFEADRYVISHPDGSWETTNTYSHACECLEDGSSIEDILTKY